MQKRIGLYVNKIGNVTTTQH